MRNWFKKTFEKKPGEGKTTEERPSEERIKKDNISSLYEIVEDHLKSLDYDQLKDIGGDFAERFAAHQEIISEIVKEPHPRGKHKPAPGPVQADPDEFVVIDTRGYGGPGFPVESAGFYPDEAMLSHYDRMIRTQYDRLIDLTMDFLREITEAEIKRLDAETAKVVSDVEALRDVLTGQVERLGEDLDDVRRFHRELIDSLDRRMAEEEERANLAARRIKILIGAVIGAGLVGGVALVLSLIR